MLDICVIGYPSRVGGADTELDHQIRVWQALGVKVHLIHTGFNRRQSPSHEDGGTRLRDSHSVRLGSV